MEGKVTRKVFKETEEEPRHTRLADIYNQRGGALFQGWGPKL
jgi:hypothetical protein